MLAQIVLQLRKGVMLSDVKIDTDFPKRYQLGYNYRTANTSEKQHLFSYDDELSGGLLV